MKFEMNFNVLCICNHYKNNDTEFKETNVELELKMDATEAFMFISRFVPSYFAFQDYRVRITNNAYGVINGLALVKENDVYIVKNLNHFLATITEGFLRLKSTEKFLQLLDFDFETPSEKVENETKIEESQLVDEFDDNE